MRTTLDIDDDVLAAVNELAASRGKPVDEAVSELLRLALQPPLAQRRVRNGVPLLPHRPGAPPITMEMVNALRDDE